MNVNCFSILIEDEIYEIYFPIFNPDEDKLRINMYPKLLDVFEKLPRNHNLPNDIIMIILEFIGINDTTFHIKRF